MFAHRNDMRDETIAVCKDQSFSGIIPLAYTVSAGRKGPAAVDVTPMIQLDENELYRLIESEFSLNGTEPDIDGLRNMFGDLEPQEWLDRFPGLLGYFAGCGCRKDRVQSDSRLMKSYFDAASVLPDLNDRLKTIVSDSRTSPDYIAYLIIREYKIDEALKSDERVQASLELLGSNSVECIKFDAIGYTLKPDRNDARFRFIRRRDGSDDIYANMRNMSEDVRGLLKNSDSAEVTFRIGKNDDGRLFATDVTSIYSLPEKELIRLVDALPSEFIDKRYHSKTEPRRDFIHCFDASHIGKYPGLLKYYECFMTYEQLYEIIPGVTEYLSGKIIKKEQATMLLNALKEHEPDPVAAIGRIISKGISDEFVSALGEQFPEYDLCAPEIRNSVLGWLNSQHKYSLKYSLIGTEFAKTFYPQAEASGKHLIGYEMLDSKEILRELPDMAVDMAECSREKEMDELVSYIGENFGNDSEIFANILLRISDGNLSHYMWSLLTAIPSYDIASEKVRHRITEWLENYRDAFKNVSLTAALTPVYYMLVNDKCQSRIEGCLLYNNRLSAMAALPEESQIKMAVNLSDMICRPTIIIDNSERMDILVSFIKDNLENSNRIFSAMIDGKNQACFVRSLIRVLPICEIVSVYYSRVQPEAKSIIAEAAFMDKDFIMNEDAGDLLSYAVFKEGAADGIIDYLINRESDPAAILYKHMDKATPLLIFKAAEKIPGYKLSDPRVLSVLMSNNDDKINERLFSGGSPEKNEGISVLLSIWDNDNFRENAVRTLLRFAPLYQLAEDDRFVAYASAKFAKELSKRLCSTELVRLHNDKPQKYERLMRAVSFRPDRPGEKDCDKINVAVARHLYERGFVFLESGWMPLNDVLKVRALMFMAFNKEEWKDKEKDSIDRLLECEKNAGNKLIYSLLLFLTGIYEPNFAKRAELFFGDPDDSDKESAHGVLMSYILDFLNEGRDVPEALFALMPVAQHCDKADCGDPCYAFCDARSWKKEIRYGEVKEWGVWCPDNGGDRGCECYEFRAAANMRYDYDIKPEDMGLNDYLNEIGWVSDAEADKRISLENMKEYQYRIGSYINTALRFRDRLKCSCCGKVMKSDFRYSKYLTARLTAQMFSCDEPGEGHDRNVYINRCHYCGEDFSIIDSRECKISDDNGFYLCMKCGGGSYKTPDHPEWVITEPGEKCPKCGKKDLEWTSKKSKKCKDCGHILNIPYKYCKT
ncbi:MAG: hypothetical protein IK093_03715 [Ruminiclostridium sp.]|nr:hypothetical protein [Ruminiclostridium sp.]